MPVLSIQPGEHINAPRGSAVVVIPAHGVDEALLACLRSVLVHTPRDVPIAICDGGESSDVLGTGLGVELLRERELLHLRAGLGGALAAAAPADVVMLAPTCVLAERWLDGLRQAAYRDATVATASALTMGPGAEPDVDAAAATIRERSLRIHPRLGCAREGCVYVRRSAIELVAASGPAFDLDTFSQRCVRAGLSHVLADDVLVAGRDRQDESGGEGETGPLARALGCARRALSGMSVVVDARILSRPITGTEVHVLELVAALARTEQVRLTVIAPDRPSPDAERALKALPSITLVGYGQGQGRADLVHRPYQVSNPGDLTFLASLGDRLILTNQDLISYHNPSYFPDPAAWHGYRKLTRLALATADHVVFFSAHARGDALAEELVEPARASVVHIGVDHPLTAAGQEPVAPSGMARLPSDADAILCLGADYHHKNRGFALRLLEHLHRVCGWRGYLVFAGPTVAHGSSRADEARVLSQEQSLADFVVDVGPVSEAEKAWLLRRVQLVVYPTTHEGFGLVPFEAAEPGVPCMWAPGTSLSEVLPDDQAGIVPWDVRPSADRAIQLLTDGEARAQVVASLRDAAAELTWDATAARLLEVYRSVCDAPAALTAALQRDDGLIGGAVSEDAMRLVGPGGVLPADVHRPLLALATHHQLGTPLFGALKAGYRVSHKLRRWGRAYSDGFDRQSRR